MSSPVINDSSIHNSMMGEDDVFIDDSIMDDMNDVYEKDIFQAIQKIPNGWSRLSKINPGNGGFMFLYNNELVNEIIQNMKLLDEHSGFSMAYYLRKMYGISKK